MRILIKINNNLEVILVTELFYDENGLTFADYFGHYYLFPEIDRNLAEYYVRTMYSESSIDLSNYICEYDNED